jgi:hypothetical protein
VGNVCMIKSSLSLNVEVGYARTDDGNYDISKPLHSISNPQPFITTVSTE